MSCKNFGVNLWNFDTSEWQQVEWQVTYGYQCYTNIVGEVNREFNGSEFELYAQATIEIKCAAKNKDS